jgi:dipeptidyl aminopeptidase/acylaminoacyl peptidase
MKYSLLIPFVLAFTASALAEGRPSGGEYFRPRENLIIEGMPRIPLKLVEQIRPYTEFRAASICGWHPVRREFLICTQFADAAQIHELKFPGGARTQLTFFKDPTWQASYQPVHGNFFVFAKDTGGNENEQKYRFDCNSGTVTLLTDGASRNTGGIWSHAGDRFVYGSTRRTGSDVDLWILDPRNSKSDKLLVKLEGGGWMPLDFSPDDRQLLVMNFVSVNESYLWLVEVSTGKMELITPKSGTISVAYGPCQFSPDGYRVFVTTDRDSEFLRLAYIDLCTHEHVYLTKDAHWDISDFRLSWDGKMIAYQSNEGGRDVLNLMQTSTGKVLAKSNIPVGLISGLTWHKNNRDLGFNFVDSRRGSDVYSLDVTTNKVDRWTFSETGGIQTDNFNPPEFVEWKSFDDRTISGWLSRPPAKFTGKRPVIIDIHGGPEGQARPWLGPGRSYICNELGVAILQPNVRGSVGFGKTFAALDNGFNREDAYKDIGSLLDWIKTRSDLDADRIMATGGSYGGHMTMAVATNYSDRIRCSLPVGGQSNLATFLKNTSAYRQDLRRVEYGDERDPKTLEFLNRTAPLTNARKIAKPFFVMQGANDPRVPLSEAQQMVRTVKQNGIPVWYVLANDEGHGFLKKQNENFQLYATVLFVQHFLLN